MESYIFPSFTGRWVQPITSPVEMDTIIDNIHNGVGYSDLTMTTAGHSGERTLTYQITEKFFWPRVAKQVKKAVAQCKQCQQKKTRHIDKASRELHPVDIPFGKQWNKIAVDLMSFKESKGYNYLMTGIDYFTKWVEMAPLETKSAGEVAYVLWTWILRHGAPETIVTDQGREFNNQIADELLRLTKCKHRVTSAYHPEANGLVERANRSSTDMLRASLLEDTSKWVELIPCIQTNHNDRKQASTKFSPFELMYGRPRRHPCEERRDIDFTADLSVEEAKEIDAMQGEDYAIKHWKTLLQVQESLFDRASENMKDAQKKMKKRFDKKYKGKPPFDRGTMVMKKIPVNDKRKGGKLEKKWDGPYRVGDFNAKNGTYELINLRGQVLKRKTPAAQIKLYHDALGEYANFGEESQEEISGVQHVDSDADTVKCDGLEDEEDKENTLCTPPQQKKRKCTPSQQKGATKTKVKVPCTPPQDQDVHARAFKPITQNCTPATSVKTSPSDFHRIQPSYTRMMKIHQANQSPHEDKEEESDALDEEVANLGPQESSPWRCESWDRIPSRSGTPTVQFNKLSRSQPVKVSGVQNKAKRKLLSQGNKAATSCDNVAEQSLKVSEKQAEIAALHDSTVAEGVEESDFLDETEEEDACLVLSSKPRVGAPKFTPLSTQTCIKICQNLKLDLDIKTLYDEHSIFAPTIGNIFNGAPIRPKSILGDGNCFFRSISFCLTGSPKQHEKLRKLVCDYIENPRTKHKFKNHIPKEVDREAYLKKMRRDGTWATEVEIFATAYLVKFDVWIYLHDFQGNKGWWPHRASGNSVNGTRQAIFLMNYANHFEPCVPIVKKFLDKN